MTLPSKAKRLELEGAIRCTTSNEGIFNAQSKVGNLSTFSNEDGDFVLFVTDYISSINWKYITLVMMDTSARL